jgi:hypothetical protein
MHKKHPDNRFLCSYPECPKEGYIWTHLVSLKNHIISAGRSFTNDNHACKIRQDGWTEEAFYTRDQPPEYKATISKHQREKKKKDIRRGAPLSGSVLGSRLTALKVVTKVNNTPVAFAGPNLPPKLTTDRRF